MIILFCIILTSCSTKTDVTKVEDNIINTQQNKNVDEENNNNELDIQSEQKKDNYIEKLKETLTAINEGSGRWQNYDLRAFSLEDVNNDKRKEIILYCGDYNENSEYMYPAEILYYNEPVDAFSQLCILEGYGLPAYESENVQYVTENSEFIKMEINNQFKYYYLIKLNWSELNTDGDAIYLYEINNKDVNSEDNEILKLLFSRAILLNFPQYNEFICPEDKSVSFDEYIQQFKDHFENSKQIYTKLYYIDGTQNIDELLTANDNIISDESFISKEIKWLLENKMVIIENEH